MNNVTEKKIEEIIDRMINLNVSLEEVTPLIGKYLYNYPINEQELIKIYSYLSETIAKYEKELDKNLDKDEVATFHYVMDCFKNSKKYLTPIETYLIERYDKVCQKEDKVEGISNSFIKRKLHPDYKPSRLEESLELTPAAFTLLPIIITVTVLLGTIIAAFLLVK